MEVSPMNMRARERLLRARALIRQKYGSNQSVASATNGGVVSANCLSLKTAAAQVTCHAQLHPAHAQIINKENNGTTLLPHSSLVATNLHQRFTPRTKTKRRIEHAKHMTFDSIFHQEFGDEPATNTTAATITNGNVATMASSALNGSSSSWPNGLPHPPPPPSASSFGFMASHPTTSNYHHHHHTTSNTSTSTNNSQLLKCSRISRLMRPTKMKTPKKYTSLKRSRTLEESSAEKKLVLRRLKTNHFTSLSQ